MVNSRETFWTNSKQVTGNSSCFAVKDRYDVMVFQIVANVVIGLGFLNLAISIPLALHVL